MLYGFDKCNVLRWFGRNLVTVISVDARFPSRNKRMGVLANFDNDLSMRNARNASRNANTYRRHPEWRFAPLYETYREATMYHYKNRRVSDKHVPTQPRRSA